ncbi:MAG: hypothetical protein R6U21_03850 [Thermoplasmatota archaeon]
MNKKLVIDDFVLFWNGSFYEIKERDPVNRLFLDMRHKQTMIQLSRYFIDMN